MDYPVEDYKPVKVLKKGGKSLQVTLMQNNKGDKIIKKQYDKNIDTHRDSFEKEIRILDKLKSYKYVPKLLSVDKKNYTFYETYCGVIVPSNSGGFSNAEQKMIERTKDLYNKYGLAYIKDGKQEWFVHRLNYCLLNGKIYMIDFGSIKWQENYKQ